MPLSINLGNEIDNFGREIGTIWGGFCHFVANNPLSQAVGNAALGVMQEFSNLSHSNSQRNIALEDSYTFPQE